MNTTFWANKTVLVTGHTGFKGGWLSLWLANLGAHVHGFALEPPTNPCFFQLTCLEEMLSSSTIADIRDPAALKRCFLSVKPQIVFHLAAQPLVRVSYQAPKETFDVNLLGTLNLFEAARQCEHLKVLINVTSDKCYQNREWVWPYREDEPLGGHDPYSASKACSEILSAAYRSSFFKSQGVHLATVRAGNVIGGGDWAKDRLIPDFIRAMQSSQTIVIRSPSAVRPWQHVLEPVSGYVQLAVALHESGRDFEGAWNFGPEPNDTKSVEWICEHLCGLMPGATWRTDSEVHPHEAHLLKLDSSKAKALLGWNPIWNLPAALAETVDWFRAWKNQENMLDVSLNQISRYSEAMKENFKDVSAI